MIQINCIFIDRIRGFVKKKPPSTKDVDIYESPSFGFVPSGQKRVTNMAISPVGNSLLSDARGDSPVTTERVLIEPVFSSDGEILLQGASRSSSVDSTGNGRPKSAGRGAALADALGQAVGQGFQRLRTSSQSQPPQTLASLEEKAAACMHEGDYAKAEKLYSQAVAITRPTYNAGGDGTDYLRNLTGYVKAIKAQNNVKNAIIAYEELVGAMRVMEGSSHQDTLIHISDLACLYRKDDQLSRAVPLFVECYNAAVRQYGDIHPNTIVSKNNLANAYADMKRYDDAERLYISCIEISKSQYGDGHESTLQYMNNLGLVYIDQKRYKEAKYMFGQCIAIGSSIYGSNHPMVQQWRQNQQQLSKCTIS